MNKEDYKVHIIGGGISGLIAANVLEQHGYFPTIIEASEGIGGRVKTDIVDGYQLDYGFQVLLTAYPAVKKHLYLDGLELQKLSPGALIFKNGKYVTIGDPLRDLSLFFPTLFSGIGTFNDKIKILKLKRILKKKTIPKIFSDKEKSTFKYLTDFGFSSKIINDFFIPFFSGIFLENKLDTSSRMFEFIYKMFGEGYAAIPKDGMQAIPKQLSKKLNNTVFRFDTKVKLVKDNEILLQDNRTLKTDYTIVTANASNLIPKIDDNLMWNSCDTLYFEVEHRNINKPLIGLIPQQGTLINNIFYHTSIKATSIGQKQLLSVTILDNKGLSFNELIDGVVKELKEHCNIITAKFIKHYNIPMALPKLDDLRYNILPDRTRVSSRVFLAGDVQLNASLNAAIISGEQAAMGVVEALKNQKD